jgi:serine protease AprX
MWAQEAPDESVPVVIQVEGSLPEAADFVTRHGGLVEHQLTLTNALSGTVPASLLPVLSSRSEFAMVTLDAPVVSTTDYSIRSDNLRTTFQETVGAAHLWGGGNPVTGSGVGVAVVDTGVSDDAYGEFASHDAQHGARVTGRFSANSGVSDQEDGFGHGTHVASIIGGYAYKAYGEYAGVAPEANLIAVKIDDDAGAATVGDVIAGLGWVRDNRLTLNIRVVNLSLSSSVAQSYKIDPLDAAVELLWLNGITVVVAAGNSADAFSFAPANDPFVITVGATDEHGTPDLADDSIAPWSSRGVTLDGFAKPEVYAPGAGIVAAISPSSLIAKVFPGGIVDSGDNVVRYRMSGTSMATGVVSGAAALLIQRHPEWSPGQVKQALIDSAHAAGDGAPKIRVDGAINTTPSDASAGLVPNYLLLDAVGACDLTIVAAESCPVEFEKISWGSVEFNKISWSKISWSKISWSKISWGSVDYTKISWSKISWGSRFD